MIITPIIITSIETRRSIDCCILYCPCDFPFSTIIVVIFFYYYHCFYFIECPNISFRNSWYIFTNKGGNWTTDRDICQSQGADLFSIETEVEGNFVLSEIQNHSTVLLFSTLLGSSKLSPLWCMVHWLRKKRKRLDLGEWKTGEHV